MLSRRNAVVIFPCIRKDRVDVIWLACLGMRVQRTLHSLFYSVVSRHSAGDPGIYILGSLDPTTQDIKLCFELYSVIVKPNEHLFLQFCNRLVIFKFWLNMEILNTLLKTYFLRSHFNFFRKLLLFNYLSVQSSGQMCMCSCPFCLTIHCDIVLPLTPVPHLSCHGCLL